MAFNPCPDCGPATPVTVTTSPSRVVTEYTAAAADVVTPEQAAVPAQEEDVDYTITWDMPDTDKERIGLAIAGGLAFLAPFVGFAVAARTARKHAGYLAPVGYGALTFFAMRAAAVGVLHYSGNLPTVSAATALGATLPQVPRRNYQLGAPGRSAGRAPCRGCR